MKFTKIVFPLLAILSSILVWNSQPTHAQSGVATLNPTSCSGDCVQTGFGWEYDPIMECSYGVGAFHTLTFDISSIDFDVDKIRLRYRADGHDGVGEYTFMDVNQFISAYVTDYGFANGYDYWELQLDGDWGDVGGDTIEIFNSHAFTGDCYPQRTVANVEASTFEVFDYYGLGSAYPPILELADANNELPPIEPVPLAVELTAWESSAESTPPPTILITITLLLFLLGCTMFSLRND